MGSDMRYSRGPGQSRISEVMSKLIATLPHGARIREGMAVVIWEEVVGPRAAAATQAQTARDGILHVRTRTSVWSQELSLLKPTILAELNRRLGGQVIRDVHFKPGKIPVRQQSIEERPDPATLRAVELTDEDRRSLSTSLAGLAGMRDKELRAKLAETIETRKRLRRWRLAHGWRECSDCGTAHREIGDLCPICRVPVNERIGPSTARI